MFETFLYDTILLHITKCRSLCFTSSSCIAFSGCLTILLWYHHHHHPHQSPSHYPLQYHQQHPPHHYSPHLYPLAVGHVVAYKVVLLLIISQFDPYVAITYYGNVTTPINGSFILNTNDRILSASKIIYLHEGTNYSVTTRLFMTQSALFFDTMDVLDSFPGYQWTINAEGFQYLEIKSSGNMELRDANNIYWQSNTATHLSTQPHSLIVDRCAYLMDNTNTVLWYMGIPPGVSCTTNPTTTSMHPSTEPSSAPTKDLSSASPSDAPSAVPTEYLSVPPSRAPQQFNIYSSNPTVTDTPSKTTNDYMETDASTDGIANSEYDPLLDTLIWIGTVLVPVIALCLCIALIVYLVKGWKQNSKMMQQITQQASAKANIEKVDDSVVCGDHEVTAGDDRDVIKIRAMKKNLQNVPIALFVSNQGTDHRNTLDNEEDVTIEGAGDNNPADLPYTEEGHKNKKSTKNDDGNTITGDIINDI